MCHATRTRFQLFSAYDGMGLAAERAGDHAAASRLEAQGRAELRHALRVYPKLPIELEQAYLTDSAVNLI
jgi:hypothetical protein